MSLSDILLGNAFSIIAPRRRLSACDTSTICTLATRRQLVQALYPCWKPGPYDRGTIPCSPRHNSKFFSDHCPALNSILYGMHAIFNWLCLIFSTSLYDHYIRPAPCQKSMVLPGVLPNDVIYHTWCIATCVISRISDSLNILICYVTRYTVPSRLSHLLVWRPAKWHLACLGIRRISSYSRTITLLTVAYF